MLPGLTPGLLRADSETLADYTEIGAGLSLDGIWAMAGAVEHIARRWMTEFMEPGEQSVGAVVRVEQPLPRPAAATITCNARLAEIRGRRYVFEVEVRNEAGELLARGVNERAVINTGS